MIMLGFFFHAGTVPLSICLGVLFGHKLLLSLVSDVFKQQFYGKLANGNKAMSIRIRNINSIASKAF
jgi:hypothetical protein